MVMGEGNRFEFLKHSIWVLLFAAGILTYDTFALASDLPPGRSIGKESISPIMMEDHSDSFIAWRRAKIKQRTVIHIDGHIDLEWISDPDLKRITHAKTEMELKQLQLDPLHFEERSLRPLSIMNYLYPAIREGMIKELYWVPPDPILSGESILNEFKNYLIDTLGRISIEDLESFKFQKGLIKGKIYGIPLIVCKLSDLPVFKEAVILDIDVDYFDPPYFESRVGLPMIWPEEFMTLFKDKGIRSDIVSICFSVKGGYLPLEYKFLGDELSDLFKRSDDISPVLPHIRRHRRSGHIYRTKKMYVEATLEFQKALDLNPEDAASHYGLGIVYRHSGKWNEASTEVSRATAIDPVYGNSLAFDADYHLNKKRYEKALAIYEEVLEKNPYYAKGIHEAGFCASKLGEWEKAVEYYRKFITLHPNFYLVHFNLGFVYAKQEKFGKEEEAYTRALELDPYFGKAHQNLGVLHMTQGKFERAIRSLQMAIEINPSFKEAHNNLGSLYARMGQYAEAINEFKKSVRIDPYYATGYSNVGKIHLMQGNLDDALTSFQRALTLDPKNLWARYYLGQSYARMGRFQETIPIYEEIIKIDPNFYLAYSDLATILGASEMDLERALKLAQKAVQLKPTAQGFGLLASLYLKRGMYGEANQAVEKGLALDPGNESILRLKEMMKRKMGGR